jgi:hypothetical protein
MDPKRVKSYSQIKMCMCVKYVWDIDMVANPNSTMILKNIPLFLKLRNFCKRKWAILFFSSFFLFQADSFCSPFSILGHLSIFFLFLSNNFCIGTCFFSTIKLVRDSNKNLEYLLGASYRVYFLCSLPV